jgi:hypothetical protein
LRYGLVPPVGRREQQTIDALNFKAGDYTRFGWSKGSFSSTLPLQSTTHAHNADSAPR